MKIELKKIKISLTHSEETTLFNADLCVNGITIGYAKNDGRGGCTSYHAYGKNDEEIKRNRELLKQAEKHCLSLPEVKCGNFTLPMNLELFIDEFIEDEINKKEIDRINKKMIKMQEINVLFGVKGKEFRAIGYGPNFKIAEMMKTEQGKGYVATLLKSALDKMQAGDEILNTNIDLSLPEFKKLILATDGYKLKIPAEIRNKGNKPKTV